MTQSEAYERLVAFARNVSAGVPGGSLERLLDQLAPASVRELKTDEARHEREQRIQKLIRGD